jgi:hypothetical protein
MGMTAPEPIGPRETRQKLQSGSNALLVCIYSQMMYDKSQLEGAISLEQLESRLGTIPKETELIFY